MYIDIPEGLQINLRDFLGKQGYSLAPFPGPGEESYVKRLRRDYYPRFHLYIKGNSLSLHLDQKKASYKGYAAHSGEYNSEVVKEEANKIKEAFANLLKEQINNFNENQK